MRSVLEESGVRLCDLIGEIGAKYDRLLPMSSPAHRLLRRAEVEFRQWIPAGYLVEGFGGNGEPAITPGIAIVNPDETTTARHGMYVAYLFAADKSTVTLTLNQGMGEMAEHLGRSGARMVLALQAATIRAALRPADIADLDHTFDLHTTAASLVDHEHANIVSHTYSLDSLPGEAEMAADLQRFIWLYALARQARETARRHGRHDLITPARSPAPKPSEPELKPSATPTAARPVLTSKPASPDEKEIPEPDTPQAELESDTKVGRKHKVTAGSWTRRGILAALVVTPFAYATPRAVADPDQDVVPQVQELPAQTAPVFTIDVSQHDWERRGGNLNWVDIRQAGIAGMCARATYGDPSGYQWPTYHFGDFAREARKAGMGLRGGYHNLVRGDQPSINRQVDWLRRELDKHNANWAMLDIERYGELVKADMWPTWDDVLRFDDRWAKLETRVLVGYIPPWNWSKHLGQPDLRQFRGPLIASNYPRQADEGFRHLYELIGGNDGQGWAAYGNRVPEGWQYSARAKVPGVSDICDVNAWRITFEKFKALLTGTHKAG
jgi:GH25 family lysozyme M1 (1,4-beta-N-acetylmuramidase)